MFMLATHYVLEYLQLMTKFRLPESVLLKIRNSWAKRKNQLITIRFYLARSEDGLKVYEYNCDSASCYMEACNIQVKWLNQVDTKGGIDAGESIFKKLVSTWKRLNIDSIIHILQDNDSEETYRSLFMNKFIEVHM
jgi:glutathionylspermidine amidase/synthetase